MNTYLITPSKGGDPYKVTEAGGVWHCDCKGFFHRHKCRHLGLAKEKQAKSTGTLPPGLTGFFDRRWFKATRLSDQHPVAIQMLVGIPGPVTIFDGCGSSLVRWDDAVEVIRTERDGGELVEVTDSASMESAYLDWLTVRRQTDIVACL